MTRGIGTVGRRWEEENGSEGERGGRREGRGEGRNEKAEIIKGEQSVSCLPSKGRWTTCAFPVRTRMVVGFVKRLTLWFALGGG